jgi:hypothetical protein
VAQARRADPYQRFAMARIVKIDLLDSQRLRLGIRRGGAHLVEHGSFDLHYVHIPFGAPPREA